MSRLRKCPICGSEAEVMVKYTPLGKRYMPYCINIECNLKGFNFMTREGAEQSWNSTKRMVDDGK